MLGLVEDSRYERGHDPPRSRATCSSSTATGSSTARTREGEFYGIERLKEAARPQPARFRPHHPLLAAGEVQGWSGGLPAEDDTTLIVVKVR